MLRRFDSWLGRTVFHPPIILACWATGWTQKQFYHWTYAGFWFWLSYSAWTRGTWVLAALDTLLMMLHAAQALWADPHKEVPASFHLRMFLFLLLTFVVWGIVEGYYSLLVTWTAIMFAEYAATIKTLPPKPLRKHAGSAQGQEG